MELASAGLKKDVGLLYTGFTFQTNRRGESVFVVSNMKRLANFLTQPL